MVYARPIGVIAIFHENGQQHQAETQKQALPYRPVSMCWQLRAGKDDWDGQLRCGKTSHTCNNEDQGGYLSGSVAYFSAYSVLFVCFLILINVFRLNARGEPFVSALWVFFCAVFRFFSIRPETPMPRLDVYC